MVVFAIVMMVVLVLIVIMVVTAALAILAVLMMMVVAVAFLTVVVMVMMLMLMIMATALAVLAVLVMVLVIMIVVMATAGAILPMFMVVMMVLVGRAVLVDVHHDAGILECVQRDMLQLVVVHIQHCGHETELDLLAGPHLAVEQDSLVQVREVHGHGLIGIADGHLYVSHQRTGFPLDPSADLHEHVG